MQENAPLQGALHFVDKSEQIEQWKKKKKSINSLQFDALFLDVLFLSTALSVPGWLINIFSGGEFIPGLVREGDGFTSLILRFTALCH